MLHLVDVRHCQQHSIPRCQNIASTVCDEKLNAKTVVKHLSILNEVIRECRCKDTSSTDVSVEQYWNLVAHLVTDIYCYFWFLVVSY